LALEKLVREIAGHPDPILRNVTVEQLSGEILTTLKTLVARREHERYEISPEEIARFSGEQAAEPVGDYRKAEKDVP
jgi:hypothetical protein